VTDAAQIALISGGFTLAGVVFNGLFALALKWNQRTLRDESHAEHVVTGERLGALAEQAAVVVTQQNVVAQQLSAQLAQNTAMTGEAAAASKEAASVANDVNNKIAATLSVVQEQQAQEAQRQDDEHHR